MTKLTRVSDSVVVINGRHVTQGTEVSISKVKGRFRFLSHDERGWINVYGGKPGYYQMRSFPEDRVETVHRTRKMKRLEDM